MCKYAINDVGSARLTKFVDGQDQNPLHLLKRIHDPDNNYYIDSVVTICLELFDHLKHSDGVADDCLEALPELLSLGRIYGSIDSNCHTQQGRLCAPSYTRCDLKLLSFSFTAHVNPYELQQ